MASSLAAVRNYHAALKAIGSAQDGLNFVQAGLPARLIEQLREANLIREIEYQVVQITPQGATTLVQWADLLRERSLSWIMILTTERLVWLAAGSILALAIK